MEGLQRTKSITLEGSSVGVGEDSSVVPMSRVGQGCLQVLCALCVDQRHSGGCVCPVLALSRLALLHGWKAHPSWCQRPGERCLKSVQPRYEGSKFSIQGPCGSLLEPNHKSPWRMRDRLLDVCRDLSTWEPEAAPQVEGYILLRLSYRAGPRSCSFALPLAYPPLCLAKLGPGGG